MTLIYTDTYYLSYMNIERSSDLKNFPLLQTSITLTLILAALWVFHDYFAFFLTLLIVSISFFVLLISYIVEFIEPTKIPKWYFQFMWTLIIIPVVLAVLFGLIYGFSYDWMKIF